MGQDSQARSRRRWWRRWLAIVSGIALSVELVWILGAQVALNTGFLKTRINRHPEKLWFEWRSGSSWIPGRIQLQDFAVRGQGHRDQWYGTAKHANLQVGLWALRQKRIVGERVDLDGVAFRIRPRVDAITGRKVNPADLPPIPGLANPPEVEPVFLPHSRARKPWTLHLPAIEIDNLEELWIKDSRVTAHGHLRGSVEHEIRGPFETSVSGLEMRDAVLWSRGLPVATNLDLGLKGRLGPMRFKVDKGLALLDLLEADTEVRGALDGLRSLERALGLPEIIQMDGVGQFAVQAGVRRGELFSQAFDVAIPSAVLRADAAIIATNLTMHAAGGLEPVRLLGAGNGELSRHLTTGVELQGDLIDGGLLARHLGVKSELALEGSGHVDAAVRMDRGRFVGPSQLRFASPDFAVRLMKVIISGAATLQVEAEGGTNDSTSRMSVTLDHLRFRHEGDRAEASDSGRLQLEATAYDPMWHEGFREVAMKLAIAPLTLPDAQVLNGFLPDHAGGSFQQGSFRLSADYARDRHGAGVGRLRVDGDAVAFVLGDQPFSGVLQISTEFQRTGPRELLIQPAHVLVTNVTVAGVRNRQADGWHARIDVDRGTVALDGSRRITADVALALLDIRPLLALLRERSDSPGWVKFVPNLKNLVGNTFVDVRTNEIVLRDFRLRGSATEILAQLKLNQGKPDGILYARYGLISAGFDFRNGARSWTIFGAKRAYRRNLKEMGLDGVTVPEGEDESPPAPAGR